MTDLIETPKLINVLEEWKMELHSIADEVVARDNAELSVRIRELAGEIAIHASAMRTDLRAFEKAVADEASQTTCAECGRIDPDDSRIRSGMKCGACAYEVSGARTVEA